MSGILEVDKLHSVSVVVRDLKYATRRYAEVFGIDAWEVRDFGPERLSDTQSYERVTTPAFRTAAGVTAPDQGVPVTFELIQPTAGESPFHEFRFVRRQGVCSMLLGIRTPDEFEVLRKALAARNVEVIAAMTVDGRLRRYFLDTRATLGGFLVEVQVPLEPGAETTIEVTERWNHAGTYTRPEGVGPLKVQGVSHFGVVVHDTMATIASYNDLLGVDKWTINDWRTEPGGLEDAYYRGKPVEHEYFTGLAQFRDFGFEVIQPTFGPSHYNREFRDLSGPGVHHMLLNVTVDQGEWDSTRDWFAAMGLPLAMGADLFNGAAHFCYYDTAEALGGYLVEAVLIRPSARQGATLKPYSGSYVIDFAAIASHL